MSPVVVFRAYDLILPAFLFSDETLAALQQSKLPNQLQSVVYLL